MLFQTVVLVLVALTDHRMADVSIPYDREWLQSISDKLTMVCPIDNVCHTLSEDELDRNYDNYASTGKKPCCTGCSCADNCGEWDNCCFPSTNKTGIHDRSNEECIHTEVITGTRFPITNNYYYVVVSCDQNRNISMKPIDVEYPWGDFYPVFSKKTHTIYKNELIAMCNGITDGIHWEPVLLCKKDASHMLSTTHFRQLLSQQLENKCSLILRYTQGSPVDLRREECFPVLHDTCFDGFSSPEWLNMSKNEIIAACKSDFISPYLKSASVNFFPKNIFCAICTYQFLADVPVCPLGDPFNVTDGSGKSSFSYFGILLSPGYIVSTIKENNQPARMACRPSDDVTTESSNCRPVLCPSGQYEQADGTCAFVSNYIFLESSHIFLRLTPVDPTHIEYIKQTSMAFTNFSVVDEPWTRIGWTLSWIYCKYVEINSNTCFLDGFLVIITRQSIAMNSEEYYSQVKTALAKKMSWKIGTVTIAFTQDIQRTAGLRRVSYNNTTLYELTSEDNLLDDNWTHEKMLGLYEQIQMTPEAVESQIERITKLHFCSHIALVAEDYRYLSGLSMNDILLYKHTNTVLYESEFSRTSRYDPSPEVCLSDTDFVEVTSSAMTLQFLEQMATMKVYLCIGLGQLICFGTKSPIL